MKLSAFGQQMAAPSAIAQLMQDLGDALNNNPDLLFLGGGNPAAVPAAVDIFQQHLARMVEDRPVVDRWLGVYQSPRGHEPLLESVAGYLQNLGWPVTERNIVVLNGGQTACHCLFNLLAGPSGDGFRNIHLPQLPEYVGYQGQIIGGDHFRTARPLVENISEHRFRYGLDRSALVLDEQSGAIAISRPTNPSAQVMPVDDVQWLQQEAAAAGIPFILDSAYGMPFPGIMDTELGVPWQQGMVSVLSASKLGLPGLRTSVVVADEPMIELLARMGAIENLAAGNTGAFLLDSLIRSGDLHKLTDVVPAFYQPKRELMLNLLEKHLSGLPYAVAEPDGAFFVWLWLKDLPITSAELYQRLKTKDVLVMAGEAFFFGEDTHWRHARECVRLNICQSDEVMAEAVRIIAQELKEVYRAVLL